MNTAFLAETGITVCVEQRASASRLHFCSSKRGPLGFIAARQVIPGPKTGGATGPWPNARTVEPWRHIRVSPGGAHPYGAPARMALVPPSRNSFEPAAGRCERVSPRAPALTSMDLCRKAHNSRRSCLRKCGAPGHLARGSRPRHSAARPRAPIDRAAPRIRPA